MGVHAHLERHPVNTRSLLTLVFLLIVMGPSRQSASEFSVTTVETRPMRLKGQTMLMILEPTRFIGTGPSVLESMLTAWLSPSTH